MGRVAKGVNCSVVGCDKQAIRSLSTEKVSAAGLKVGRGRRAYLCKVHYKEYKRKTKREKMAEKWRFKGQGSSRILNRSQIDKFSIG